MSDFREASGIHVVGDVHDAVSRFIESIAAIEGPIIQVGDFGFNPARSAPDSARWVDPGKPVFFVDGNRDHDYSVTSGLVEPTEVAPNLIYVPRATVLEIDHRRVGFLGGGDSITDRAFRKPGIDWWSEEAVTEVDVARLVQNSGGQVDLLITHTPPAFVVLEMSSKPPSPSAWLVESAFSHLGCPETVSGHQHKSFVLGQCRVLGVLEVAVI